MQGERLERARPAGLRAGGSGRGGKELAWQAADDLCEQASEALRVPVGNWAEYPDGAVESSGFG